MSQPGWQEEESVEVPASEARTTSVFDPSSAADLSDVGYQLNISGADGSPRMRSLYHVTIITVVTVSVKLREIGAVHFVNLLLQ